MYRKLNRILALTCSLFLYVSPLKAEMLEVYNVTLQVFATSTAENQASFLIPFGGTLSPICNGMVYVVPADKHILATAISAKASSLVVSIRYNTDATPITLGSWGGAQRRCKVETLWMP